MLGTASVDITADGEQEHHEIISHPEDANAAYRRQPTGWFLTWGTSIVARDLVSRIGGLATGMRLVADSEFVYRAHYAARIVNVARCCYYRRRRPDALTCAPDTGFGSAVREQQRLQIRARCTANALSVAKGHAPDLSPLAVSPLPELRHILGPRLLACEADPAASR
jgi:hypothetical protein